MGKYDKGGSGSNDPNQITINDRFVDACSTGDYQTVSLILNSIKDFNIDVTDKLGRTALRLAVANENIECVQLLLLKSDAAKMREALLLAIYMGHTLIAQLILNHPQYKLFNEKKFLNGATDSFWQTPSSDDAQFPPDITPIMLASQYNRTEIVQMLLLNGERIEKPHDFFCKCNECSNRFKFDSLRHAQSRLNAYRGLASEDYIALGSIDPILTAFELAYELKILAEKEKYFKSEYLELAKNLSEFTVKLLDNVRGRDELEIVLNKIGKETEEKFILLGRFDLAIKYGEMPFVAHPNCQQKLGEIWYTGVRRITKMNQMLALFVYFCFIISIPVLAIGYIIAPNSKIGKFMSLPIIKFISNVASYIAFIGLIIGSSLEFVYVETTKIKFSNVYPGYYLNYTEYVESNLTFKFDTPDFYIRSNKPSNLDILICIWVVGLIINDIKYIYLNGVRDYFLSWNNILNSVIFSLLVASYGLKFYTMIAVSIEKNKLYDDFFWHKVHYLSSDDFISQQEIYSTFYWLNNDRFYWYSFDPINLSEGLFSISTVLCFAKLCFFLPANQNLGPLQITLGRMIAEILKFMCIFVIVFTGFLFGLNNLYQYYQSSVRDHTEIVKHYNEEFGPNITYVNAELYFGTLDITFRTMFWSIFFIGNNQAAKIDPFKNQLTLLFGYLIIGMFNITTITIFINMLIASMVRSYEVILNASDIEWKFSRSRLYMEFLRGPTLPVPFNIIPMPSIIFNIFKKIFFCFFKKQDNEDEDETGIEMPTMNGSLNGNVKSIGNGRPGKGGDGEKLNHKKVMERVIKRLLLHNNRENDEIKESDFDELKQDVQMIRFDVMNGLKSTKEDALKYVKMFHNGISLLGDFLFESKNDDENHLYDDFRVYKTHEKKLELELELIKNPNKILAIQSSKNDETSSQNSHSPTDSTDPILNNSSYSSKQDDNIDESNSNGNNSSLKDPLIQDEDIIENVHELKEEENNFENKSNKDETLDHQLYVQEPLFREDEIIANTEAVIINFDQNE